MAEYSGTTRQKTENEKVSTPLNTEGDYGQSDEEKKDFEMVMALFERGKSARNHRDMHWQQYQDFYDGKQWQDRRPSYKASPNINIVRSTIETILPILTDAHPGFDVIPSAPEDYEFADVISKSVDSWWANSGMDLTMTEAVKDSLIYDCAILKVIWDPEAKEGLGDIVVSVIDPRNIYVPEDAVDFIHKCGWVIERVYKPVGEVKRLFSEHADKIKATGPRNIEDDKAKTQSGTTTLVSPIDQKSPISLSQPSGTGMGDLDVVELLECWVDSYEMEEYEYEEDGETKTGEKKKYPNGKIITVIPSCKLVLQTEESPYADGRKPYVKLVDTPRSRKFWGSGEVEPLVDLQKILNRTVATIIDYMNSMSNPVWIVDTDSGVDPEMLTNQIGLIIAKNRGTEVRREAPAALPSEVFTFYEVLQRLADQASGINDVTQGRRPQGITAAEALQTMQEAAQTRIRLKERNLQTSLARLGELVISRMLQYYTEPRIVQLVGQGTKWPEYFEWYVEPVEDGKKQMHFRHYEQQPDGSPGMPEDWRVAQPSWGLFDVKVSAGTSLPFLREKRGQLALRLREAEVIDDEELLKTLDWPRYQEVLRRVESKRAEQAQAEQAQAQAMPQQGVMVQ